MKILIIDDTRAREETYRKALSHPDFDITFQYECSENVIEPNFDFCIIDYYLSNDEVKNRSNDETPLNAAHILKRGNPISNGPVMIVSDQINTFIDKQENVFTPEFNKLINSKCQPSDYRAFSYFEEATVNAPLKERLYNLITSLVKKCKDKVFVDIVVITALESELKPMLDLLEDNTIATINKTNDIIAGHLAEVKTPSSSKKLFLLHNEEMGQVETMLKLHNVQRRYNFNHVVMIGVCGGNIDKTNIGDVIIPKKSTPYQDGKLKADKFIPRNSDALQKSPANQTISTFKINKYAQNFYKSRNMEIKEILDLTEPNTHTDGMLCGSAVIDKEEELKKLAYDVGDEKVRSVDMESYAVYYFSQKEEMIKSSCVIKSVMDYGGDYLPNKEKTEQKGKNDDFKEYCSQLSAHVLFQMIINEEFFTNK